VLLRLLLLLARVAAHVLPLVVLPSQVLVRQDLGRGFGGSKRLHSNLALATSDSERGCLSAAPRLHLGCISAAPRLHLGCISAVSRLHLGNISDGDLVRQRDRLELDLGRLALCVGLVLVLVGVVLDRQLVVRALDLSRRRGARHVEHLMEG